MEFRKDEMWADGRYEYERLPRHRLPRDVPSDPDYYRVVNAVRRPEDDGYHRYEDYNDPDYREYSEGHGYERRGGPYRGEDPGYRWPRGDPHMSRHPEYRDNREGFRRKPLYPGPYARERSPHRRESPYPRESPGVRRESPHSRSGSSVSSRSYSPERSKTFTAHQQRSKERSSAHPLRSSKDPSPSSSAAIPNTKASSSSALYGDQSTDLEANVSVNSEIYESNPLSSRSKAIAAKTREIEEVYRQDCETFGMVVKMLIDKDPALEKPVQFALRQNLSEIGERCIEELKLYITEYDAAHQELA